MLYFHFNTKGITCVTTSDKVKEPVKVKEINKIDGFSFYIHLSNPVCDQIVEKLTRVTIFDDFGMDVTFRGRVYKKTSDSSTGFMYIICEGPLGYLRDTYWRGPDAQAGQHIMNYVNGWLVPDCNLFLPDYAQFSFVGLQGPDGGPLSANNSGTLIEDIELQGLSHFEVLDKLTSSIGWEFMVTYSPSTPHYSLYIAPYFGYKATTPIATGLNLKSLSKESDLGEFYNRVFPLGGYGYDGKRLTLKEARIADATTIDSRPEYTSISGYPTVTLTGNSTYNYLTGETFSSYVENVPLVEKYGPISKCVIFDYIVANSPEEVPELRQLLYKAAQQHARRLSDKKEEFQISGYDIHRAGYPVDELITSNFYECIDIVTNTHVVARLSKMSYSYERPLEPDLEFIYNKADTECATR